MKNKNLNSIVIPLRSYYNIIESKSVIYKESKNKSVIYRWVNKINNKCYIGSAIDLSKRLRMYYSLGQLKRIVTKESSRIYNAIIKYGYSNFRLDILEYCNKEHIIEREQFYIDLLNPEYNILKVAGSRFGSKVTFKTRKAISISSRGRKISTKCKLVANYSSKIVTSYTKLKLSLRSQGVKVKIFDSSKNFINEFPNIKSAAQYVGVKYTTISKIYNTGISYDNYIYEFELKDIRVWIYNCENKFIEILDNAKKTSEKYNIPKSTLSNYIKSGKLYKKEFYFYSINSKNNPFFK